ncbi:hypothetical protein [Epibacterium ulvae]|uniref:hypothetical protein n=1 Tax=Epibacterium ulvae TaxID=1156985 RepID=UPI0024916A4C|nr:hypothetical protein [Epibacterium ulvae]
MFGHNQNNNDGYMVSPIAQPKKGMSAGQIVIALCLALFAILALSESEKEREAAAKPLVYVLPEE